MTPFTAEIELHDDPDEGLRFDAPETFVRGLSQAVTDAGLTIAGTRIGIQGTANIPSLIEVSVTGGAFDTMKSSIHDVLVSHGVKVTEENFSGLGVKHIRFNLDNVSVFAR